MRFQRIWLEEIEENRSWIDFRNLINNFNRETDEQHTKRRKNAVQLIKNIIFHSWLNREWGLNPKSGILMDERFHSIAIRTALLMNMCWFDVSVSSVVFAGAGKRKIIGVGHVLNHAWPTAEHDNWRFSGKAFSDYVW